MTTESTELWSIASRLLAWRDYRVLGLTCLEPAIRTEIDQLMHARNPEREFSAWPEDRKRFADEEAIRMARLRELVTEAHGRVTAARNEIKALDHERRLTNRITNAVEGIYRCPFCNKVITKRGTGFGLNLLIYEAELIGCCDQKHQTPLADEIFADYRRGHQHFERVETEFGTALEVRRISIGGVVALRILALIGTSGTEIPVRAVVSLDRQAFIAAEGDMRIEEVWSTAKKTAIEARLEEYEGRARTGDLLRVYLCWYAQHDAWRSDPDRGGVTYWSGPADKLGAEGWYYCSLYGKPQQHQGRLFQEVSVRDPVPDRYRPTTRLARGAEVIQRGWRRS